MQPEKFNVILRKLIDHLGITQSEMGKKLGVSRNMVSMMLREDKEFPPSRAVRMNFDREWEKTFGEQADNSTEWNLSEESSRLREEAPRYDGARGKLRAARIAKGLTPAQLAAKVGYSLEVYQNIEDGFSQMGEKMAARVAQELGLDMSDLLDGADEPPSKGPLHGTVGAQPEIQLPNGQKARFVPLLSMAQCGNLMAYDDTGYVREGVLAINPTDRHTFAVTLAGDSMQPKLDPGDVAFVSPSQRPRNNSVVIARLNEDHGGDVMCKIYQASGEAVTLSSYNDSYPPMTYPRSAFQFIYPVHSVNKVLHPCVI